MITVEQVKAFRKETGANMMLCKKALKMSDGNKELAIWVLKNYPTNPPYDWWRNKEGENWIKNFEETKMKIK